MSYTTQLAIEVVSVGALTYGAFIVVSKLMPRSSLPTQLFITGAGLHLSLELMGVNKWYLMHGAASYPSR